MSELHRETGVGRSTLYRWKRKLADNGALTPSAGKRAKGGRPPAVSTEMETLILEVSRANPSWGCKRLSSFLKMLGVFLSSPTIQKLLIHHGRGRIGERLSLAATQL